MKHLRSLLAAALLAGTFGCCKEYEPETPLPEDKVETEPTEKKDAGELPDIPGTDEEEEVGATEILVKTPAAAGPQASIDYTQDEKFPAGALAGICRFVEPAADSLPPAEPLDLEKGPSAIQAPKEGELEYYRNLGLTVEKHLSHSRMLRRVVPDRVVLVFRNVKVGHRPPLARPAFVVKQGVFSPHIAISHPGTRIYLGTVDAFPTDIMVTRAATGEVVFQTETDTYDPRLIDLTVPWGSAVHQRYQKKPTIYQTEMIREPGRYDISSRRHPWKKAHVFIVENPYAIVVSDRYAGGQFNIEPFPVGKYAVDVWHPIYTPVTRTIVFEVLKDDMTEIAVDFETPPELRPPAGKR